MAKQIKKQSTNALFDQSMLNLFIPKKFTIQIETFEMKTIFFNLKIIFIHLSTYTNYKITYTVKDVP